METTNFLLNLTNEQEPRRAPAQEPNLSIPHSLHAPRRLDVVSVQMDTQHEDKFTQM